jgi:hypothetical protein
VPFATRVAPSREDGVRNCAEMEPSRVKSGRVVDHGNIRRMRSDSVSTGADGLERYETPSQRADFMGLVRAIFAGYVVTGMGTNCVAINDSERKIWFCRIRHLKRGANTKNELNDAQRNRDR